MKSSKGHIVLSILLLGIALCLGWLAQRYNVSTDLTANARHSLSETSTRILNSIDTPVEIIAVIGPDVQQRDAITSLVDRLQHVKNDISLTFVNPETDPATVRALGSAASGELILRSADRETRLKNLSERTLASSLRQLNRENDKSIAFITGHDERSPLKVTNHDWSTAATRLSAIGLVSYEHSLVSQPVLDDSIDLVVIAAPRRSYFPGEVASLNQYINAGGNLLWLTEQSSTSATGPKLTLLSDLIGVDTLSGTVIDTASQGLAADSPDFVLLTRLPNHPITQVLNSPILLPQASALSVTPLAGQEVLPLLQTEASSWTETGELKGAISFNENSDEVAGPLLLGVTIERSLPSTTQRIAVIGDADFAASQFIDNGDNQAFIEALLLWLTDEDNALEFVTQSAPDSELSLDNRSIVFLSAIYLAGIPLLFLIGAAVMRWRRSR